MTTGLVEADEIEFPPLEAASLEEPGSNTKDAPPTGRRRRSDAGKPRGPRSTGATRVTAASTAQLEKDLLTPIATLGQALSFSLPTVGAVLIARGEATSKALVNFAKGHPKMLEALQKVGKVGPATDLIQTLAMCVIAAQLDLQRMHPEHPIAQVTGVSAIYQEMYGHMAEASMPGDDAPDPSTGGFDNIAPPPPSMYVVDGFQPDGTFQAPPMFAAGQGAAVRNQENGA